MSNQTQVTMLEAQLNELRAQLKQAKEAQFYADAKYVASRGSYTDNKGNVHGVLTFTLMKGDKAIGKPFSLGKSKLKAISACIEQVNSYIA